MVAPSVLKQRNRDAVSRMEDAANALVEEYPELSKKAEDLKDIDGRDYIHKESNRLVALADLVEGVAEAVGAKKPRKLEDVDGIGPDLAATLRHEGYETPDDLKKAGDEDLLEVEGIGPASLKKIRADL